MSEMYGVEKTNKLQDFFIKKCQEAYGDIGGLTFLRCVRCHALLTANRVEKVGFCDCQCAQFRPASLSFAEELRMLAGAMWKSFRR